MKRLSLALAFVFFSSVSALAQIGPGSGVGQHGAVTPGDVACWYANGLIADTGCGSGGGSPGGSTNSVQYNAGSSTFGGVSLGANQLLIGQTSNPPTTLTLGTGVGTALTANLNGSGAIAATTSPTFVTPVLGVAGGTSFTLGGATLPTNGILAGNYSPGANTATPGELISNTNVASSGNQQFACIQTGGQGWKTTSVAASEEVDTRFCTIPIQGTTTPSPGFAIATAVNGGSYMTNFDYGVTTPNLTTVSSGLNINGNLALFGSGNVLQFGYIGSARYGEISVDSNRYMYLEGGTGTSIELLNGGNTQFGAADAASPVAETLSFQSVVAGTSNAAGALAKFLDSAGTGTGASGGFEWDTHPLGSSGTAQNAAALALAINSAGTFTLDTAIYASCTALTTNGSGVLGCTASDPRLKNIDRAPYSGGLKDVLRITPISFRGKPGNEENVDTRHQAGFNCWNVRDVLPLATHEDGRGFCNLDPEALVAALYNAVKEQQTEIATIRHEIRK